MARNPAELLFPGRPLTLAEVADGAEGLVAHAEKKLGCKLGESTADGRIFMKREEECLAACCGAPREVG